MSFENILIVDDEASIHRLLEHHLSRQHFHIATASSLAEAAERSAKERFDLILLDLCLPDGDGIEFLQCKVAEPVAPVVVVMSGYSSMETAIRCIRAGAFDYLAKPFTLEELKAVMHRAETLRQKMGAPAAAGLRVAPPSSAGCEERILGETPAMAGLRALVMKIAPTDTPALIVGESGTGKERLAEALHYASARREGPLVKVNGGAGREEQIENELFGSAESAGGIELAQGGTLLIEEIDALPPRAQVRLLRVLQQRQFERNGEGIARTADFRLVATSRRDLAEAVARGAFRQDLAFRLEVLPLRLPPLRERLADLPLLVAHWVETYGRRNGVVPGGFSDEALRALAAYSWPGNLRELENALERAAILTGFDQQGKVEASAFDFLHRREPLHAAAAPAMPEEPLLTLDELERRHVLRALEYTKQNRTRAAGLLKISVRTLRNKLHQYRSEDPTLACAQGRFVLPAPSPVSSGREPLPSVPFRG